MQIWLHFLYFFRLPYVQCTIGHRRQDTLSPSPTSPVAFKDFVYLPWRSLNFPFLQALDIEVAQLWLMTCGFSVQGRRGGREKKCSQVRWNGTQNFQFFRDSKPRRGILCLTQVRPRAEQIQAGAGLPTVPLHGCEHLQQCQGLQGMKDQKYSFSVKMRIPMSKASVFFPQILLLFSGTTVFSKIPNVIIFKAFELVGASYFEFRNKKKKKIKCLKNNTLHIFFS